MRKFQPYLSREEMEQLDWKTKWALLSVRGRGKLVTPKPGSNLPSPPAIQFEYRG
jgi:hypothetical protein